MGVQELYQLGEKLATYIRQDSNGLNKRKILAWANDITAGDESRLMVLRNLIDQPMFSRIIKAQGEAQKTAVKDAMLTDLSRILSSKAIEEAEIILNGILQQRITESCYKEEASKRQLAIGSLTRAKESRFHLPKRLRSRNTSIALTLSLIGLAISLHAFRGKDYPPTQNLTSNTNQDSTASKKSQKLEPLSKSGQTPESDQATYVYANSFPGSNKNYFSSSWNEANSEREYFYTDGGCWFRCELSPDDQGWTERVPRVKEFESGAVYFPTQVLANGAQVGGSYMCKLSTVENLEPRPRWAVCTKDGWSVGEEGASPVFIKS